MFICPLEADPSYKLVIGTTEPKTSRIPFKSATARKFERAHQRQFTKQVFMSPFSNIFYCMTEKSLLGNRVPFMREHKLDCANPFRLAQRFFSALIHVADLRNSMWYNMNVLRMYTHNLELKKTGDGNDLWV